MNSFIKNIHINKLFHLENFDIPITDVKYPHLIITGKNGSGKTVLLNAIADFLDKIKGYKNLGFLSLSDTVKLWSNKLESNNSEKDRAHAKMMLLDAKKKVDDLYGNLNIDFVNWEFIEKYQKGEFILAYYLADRKYKMIEPETPRKPSIEKIGNLRQNSTEQFLNFLVDLKFQESLALLENDSKAILIKEWYKNFEELLRHIYHNNNLKLQFDSSSRKYEFKICDNEKLFGFNEMSDGYKAALNIVVDLILKMQDEGSISSSYNKEGIVLIDEIETHLHLELQKIIMPLLTKVFPNIQFIVTTHSPFVLSSMSNAVAYDLESREVLDDLTEYSYEALAEGYFGVKTQSSYAEMQLNKFKKLLKKENLSDSEKIEILQLKSDFAKIAEASSPLIVGEYRQILIRYAEKLKDLQL